MRKKGIFFNAFFPILYPSSKLVFIYCTVNILPTVTMMSFTQKFNC